MYVCKDADGVFKHVQKAMKIRADTNERGDDLKELDQRVQI